jgi:hypothetical protein
MKKTAGLLIALLPLFLLSCFEFVGTGMSKRMLNLALAAPGDVAKIHVAVFEGVATPDRLISRQSFAAGSSIPIDVPAGDNRLILVWAEGFSGNANYFGSFGPVSIDENGNTPLPIRMIRFNNNAASFNLTYIGSPTNLFNWNLIPGALTYELYFTHPMFFTPYNVVSTGNSYYYNGIGYTPTNTRIRVLTSVFDLGSDWSN